MIVVCFSEDCLLVCGCVVKRLINSVVVLYFFYLWLLLFDVLWCLLLVGFGC